MCNSFATLLSASSLASFRSRNSLSVSLAKAPLAIRPPEISAVRCTGRVRAAEEIPGCCGSHGFPRIDCFEQFNDGYAGVSVGCGEGLGGGAEVRVVVGEVGAGLEG